MFEIGCSALILFVCTLSPLVSGQFALGGGSGGDGDVDGGPGEPGWGPAGVPGPNSSNSQYHDGGGGELNDFDPDNLTVVSMVLIYYIQAAIAHAALPGSRVYSPYSASSHSSS